MSKILKVVGDGPERRTYVEGGPACWEEYFSPHEYKHPPDCRTCCGTMLLPVELWPDARKADKLCEWGYDGFDYAHGFDGMVASVESWATGKRKVTAGKDGKNLTEALTNLIIAVAEEQE